MADNDGTVENDNDEEHSKTVSIFFLLFAMLLSTVLILSKQLHKSPRLNAIMSEAALVLLVGMFVSFFIEFFFIVRGDVTNDDDDAYMRNGDDDTTTTTTTTPEITKSAYLVLQLVSFKPNVFFMGLLPPILFNAGYELQREMFFRHIKPISLFAVVGTCLSAVSTGFLLYFVKLAGWMGNFNPTLLELLTWGSLISATDTVSTLGVFQAKKVDPHIFYLVFGESALNDAVALVLFHSFRDFMTTPSDEAESLFHAIGSFFLKFAYEAIGSPILGIFAAFISAHIFKFIDMRDTKVLELSLYLLLMYTPFIIAENIWLSGMVTIFFTGMSARRYCEPNVSHDTKKNAKAIFKLAAFLTETCIFLELGLSIFGLSGGCHWGFTSWGFLATLLGRAVSIYPISFYYNWSLGEIPTNMVVFDLEEFANALTPKIDEDDNSSVQDSITIESSSSKGSKSSSPKIKRETPEKRKDKEIPVKFMHVLWFSGLRGAVAYACARRFPDLYGNRNEFLGATAVIVLVSIIVMGGAMGPLLQILGIRTGVSEDDYMEEWRKERQLKGPFHRFEHKFIFRSAVRTKAHKNSPHQGKEFVVEVPPILSVGKNQEHDAPPLALDGSCKGTSRSSLHHNQINKQERALSSQFDYQAANVLGEMPQQEHLQTASNDSLFHSPSSSSLLPDFKPRNGLGTTTTVADSSIGGNDGYQPPDAAML